ncbi:MAG: LacI family DNA-binding transcriptional regulator [Eubacteriales bacterium]|nr:LacI family DNA-binding transcriptional regulator [Eubacteriales bacterium]
MVTRVTIQDIADALGVSRNTVSKAINNTGVLADATREKIIQKAIEMGYKQFSYINDIQQLQQTSTSAPSTEPEVPRKKGELALLTTAFLGNSHFASMMLDKFQKEIFSLGYSLTMYRILEDELKDYRLPSAFNKERVDGIICIEVFDYDYSRMICDLDIPTLFVDTPVIGLNEPLKADCLYMNNQAHIFTFVKEMVRRGKTRIGFIGAHMHCQSFNERYMAFRNAMFLSDLPVEEQFCITGGEDTQNDTWPHYKAYLTSRLSALPEIPDVFICANDFVALDALAAFRDLNLSVPEDLYLCGFDDSPESKLVSPNLTTIHIHTQIMGLAAAQLLFTRIQEPSLNYRTLYAETNIVYRASTGD